MAASDPQPSIDELVPAEEPATRPQLPAAQVRRRRVRLPIVLFVLTVLSTVWVGVMEWQPDSVFQTSSGQSDEFLDFFMPVRRNVLGRWQEGLVYSACLLGILFCHEMGHFLATVRYGIPASYPFFIPIPITPIGTMGAVIGMDGMRANRKEMFDIGIAGPLAGLVVAVPVVWIGVKELELTGAPGGISFHMPLLVKWIATYIRPDSAVLESVPVGQMNPYLMAGWVGLLITGLNMLPVSQLDGGHVTYTLFGRGAHWMARGFMVLVIAYVVYSMAHIWMLMIFLVMLIGTDHPPTYDDSVPIGWTRYVTGCVSMAIPILCFPPKAITIL